MHDTAGQDDAARLLSTFLRGRDALCPMCHYNLRDLTGSQCPECRHELQLTVGVTKPRFLWFLVAVAPCVFAGIAAGLLLIPMTVQWLAGGGVAEAPIIALDGMGWLSALGGLILVRYRFVFLRRTPGRQRRYAAAVWGLHVLALLAWFVTVLIASGGP